MSAPKARVITRYYTDDEITALCTESFMPLTKHHPAAALVVALLTLHHAMTEMERAKPGSLRGLEVIRDVVRKEVADGVRMLTEQGVELLLDDATTRGVH